MDSDDHGDQSTTSKPSSQFISSLSSSLPSKSKNRKRPPPSQTSSNTSHTAKSLSTSSKAKRTSTSGIATNSSRTSVKSQASPAIKEAPIATLAAIASSTSDSGFGLSDSGQQLQHQDEQHHQQKPPGRKQRRKESFKIVESLLGIDYQPTPQDVICQRGREARTWPGNQTFRSLIESNLQLYQLCQTKKEKSVIVSSIVVSIRSTTPPGKFIRKHPKDGRWYETGDDFAREKVGQGFRDKLHTEYKSSSKAKISRRKESTRLEQEFEEFMARDPSDDPLLEGMKKSLIEQSGNVDQTSSSADSVNISSLSLPATMSRHNVPDSLMIEGSNAFPGDPVGEVSSQPGRSTEQARQSPGDFPYPSSLIGTVDNDGRQQILMDVARRSSMSFDEASFSFPSQSGPMGTSAANSMTRNQSMTSRQVRSNPQNLNSFYDRSLSLDRSNVNVEISDHNQWNNQRLQTTNQGRTAQVNLQVPGPRSQQPVKNSLSEQTLQSYRNPRQFQSFLSSSVRDLKFPFVHSSMFDGGSGSGETDGICDGTTRRSLTHPSPSFHHQSLQQQYHDFHQDHNRRLQHHQQAQYRMLQQQQQSSAQFESYNQRIHDLVRRPQQQAGDSNVATAQPPERQSSGDPSSQMEDDDEPLPFNS